MFPSPPRPPIRAPPFRIEIGSDIGLLAVLPSRGSPPLERTLYTAKLLHSTHLSQQTKHLEFQVQELDRFDFLAGQFISMKARHGERDLTRAYSIASPPYGNARFDLCLNRVRDGFFSNLLCDLKDGETVQFHGAHGNFYVKDPLSSAIFIATGTGVAPIRGMVQWIFADPDRHRGRDFWLVYGTRHETDIYYQSEFEALAARHPNFKYLVTISRPQDSWKGLRGYVQDHVRPIAHGRPDSQAYICGLKDMVQGNRALLAELGWDKKHVHFERFD